ncbi:MAG: DUF4097 family beta strand repeat-containing protein [Elusimicrobiales bacterium]|nr:DUF4097 family beta strand repeat-containing protein [Elusimicrobiales bacterium]
MLKFLLKLSILTALVVGVILLMQHLGPLGPDTKVMLKWIGLGALGLAALCIVSITLLGLAGIAVAIFAISRGPGAGEGMAGGLRGLKGLSALSALGSLKGLGDVSKYASRTVEISVPKFDAGSFKIKTLTGDLRLAGHSEEGARATVEVLEKEENDAEVCFEGGEIKVKSKSGRKAQLGDVKVFLPARLASLEAESVNGDIIISGFETGSQAAFKGVNGDISVSGLKSGGEAAVKTVSGDVRINDSQFDSLSAQSVSGDVDLKDLSAGSVTVKTVSGDIRQAGNSFKKESYVSVSGKVPHQ